MQVRSVFDAVGQSDFDFLLDFLDEEYLRDFLGEDGYAPGAVVQENPVVGYADFRGAQGMDAGDDGFVDCPALEEFEDWQGQVADAAVGWLVGQSLFAEVQVWVEVAHGVGFLLVVLGFIRQLSIIASYCGSGSPPGRSAQDFRFRKVRGPQPHRFRCGRKFSQVFPAINWRIAGLVFSRLNTWHRCSIIILSRFPIQIVEFGCSILRVAFA